MFMKSTVTAALLAVALGAAAAPMPAMAAGAVTAEMQAQITQMLTTGGYEVRKIVPENGMIEVYALKDGQMLELYLDAGLNIVRIKQK